MDYQDVDAVLAKCVGITVAYRALEAAIADNVCKGEGHRFAQEPTNSEARCLCLSRRIRSEEKVGT